MTDIFAALCFLLVGGICALFLNRAERLAGFVTLLSFIGASALVVSKAASVFVKQESLIHVINLGMPMGLVRFEVDGLSAFFLVLIYFFSLLALFYGQGCMRPYYKKGLSCGVHFFFFNLLAVSMTVVVTIHNALGFLIAWEVMSLSSFFLVFHEHCRVEVRERALNYLVTMHVSAIFLIIAFVVLVVNTGSMDFAGFAHLLSRHDGLSYVVFLLFFIGFGFKTGFFPFHTALPQTYAVSHASISTVMSGVMKKIAFYGLFRIISLINIPQPSIGYTVIFVSLITCLYGIFYGLTQKDMKKILAYSSIENAGIIGIAMAVGILGLSYHISSMAVLGFAGALFHILNHALFKGLLFMGAGAVYHVTGTRNIESMGGLLKKMPVTGWTFLFGAMALCALPPFNGFISEFLIYSSLLMGIESSFGMLLITRIITAAGVAFTGGVALICLTKVFGIAFVGHPRTRVIDRARDPGFFMTIPLVILAFLCLLLGLWPQVILKLLHTPLNVLTLDVPLAASIEINMLQMAGNISKLSLILLITALVIVTVHHFLLRKRTIRKEPTWGCGYGALSHRMQYTGSSFSDPAVSLLFSGRKNVKGPEGFFPSHLAMYSSLVKDVIEMLFDRVVWKSIKWFLNKFSWIQSGQKQHYILYILVVLVCFVVAAFWGER